MKKINKPFSLLFLNLILLCLVLLTSSCAHSAQKWIRKGIVPKERAYSISVNNGTKDSIKVLYTGCGGLVIFKGNEGLMTDPYYTGHGLLNLSHMKIDTKNDARVLAEIHKINDPKNIAATLISHSHYDHLQDLPYLLDQNLLNPNVKIIGDSSTNCTLKPFLKPNHNFIYSDAIAFNPKTNSTDPLKWIRVSDHLRVLVIASDHAPHYRKIHKMRGNTCHAKTPITKATDKSSYKEWLEGRTFSFLVDVTDDSNTKAVLRLYIQPSSCPAPNGFPPKTLLDEKKVDVAFLGVASSDWVKPYPKDLLDHLKDPEKIILIHWEDFFRGLYKKRVKSVRLTHTNRFMKHMRTRYNCRKTSELTSRISMPKPLSIIKITY